MDLLSFKLRLPERRLDLLLRDASGEREINLDGEAFDRTLAAAEPLLVRLAQEGGGPVQHLAVDAREGTLLCTCLRQTRDVPTEQEQQALLHQHGVNMGE